MKILLVFTFILGLFSATLYATDGCDQVISDTSISVEQDLEAYLIKLINDQIISANDLSKFLVKLKNGSLINPVPHTRTQYGPVFTGANLLASYKTFENYLSLYKQNPRSMDLQKLQSIVANELRKQEQDQGNRKVVTGATNFVFKLEKAMIKNDNFAYRLLFDLFSKNFKQSNKLIFSHFAESGSGFIPTAAIRYLAQFRSNNYSFARELLNRENAQVQAAHLITDDGSESFYSFIEEASQLDITPYALANIIEKIEDPTPPRINILLKKLVQHEKDEVGQAAIEVLAKDHSPATIDFLKEIAQNSKISIFVRYQTVYQLTLMGYGKEIIENQRLYGYDLRGISWGELPTLSDEELVELVELCLKNPAAEDAIPLLQGRNSKAALSLLENLTKGQHLKNMTRAILQALSRRDAPSWAFQFIKKNILNGNDSTKDLAIDALSGKSSRESRDFIEEYSQQLTDDRDLLELYKALVGRPKEDLLYFFNKYVDHPQYAGFASMALVLFYGQEDLNIVSKAQALIHYSSEDFRLYIKSIDQDFNDPDRKISFYNKFPEVSALYYLASLPVDKYTNFWRDLALNHPQPSFRTFAYKRLIGQVDADSIQAIKKGVQDPDKEIRQAAMAAYIYYYAYMNQDYAKYATEIAECEKLL